MTPTFANFDGTHNRLYEAFNLALTICIEQFDAFKMHDSHYTIAHINAMASSLFAAQSLPDQHPAKTTADNCVYENLVTLCRDASVVLAAYPELRSEFTLEYLLLQSNARSENNTMGGNTHHSDLMDMA